MADQRVIVSEAANGGSSQSQSQRLSGKICVITGGASGIGKATAAAFIRNGATVIIADINHDLGQRTAVDLGPSATFFPCDVSSESQIAALVDHAVATHGRLDVLHNNAGVAGSLALSITALDLADYDRTMTINVRSAVAGVKHAARVMIPQGSGSILCTASITGYTGGISADDYSVSKAAVLGLVKSASAELCGHGIRINCISPYVVPTPLGPNGLRAKYPTLPEDQIHQIMKATGLYETSALKGAKCEAEDIANAALFLASDEAKYVSGHNLVVDGGFTAFKRLASDKRV